VTDQAAPVVGESSSFSTPDPLVERVLEDRYRIVRRVAGGGMATVYEGVDLRLDRPIAVKVMHQGLGNDAEFAARLVREARSAAQLAHPNIVSVFDQGTDGDLVFLIMEFVEGETLRGVLDREGHLPPDLALHVTGECLKGLAAAHAVGIVHRDMKPENILCAPDGGVKVADFGLARAVTGATQHTNPGGLIGTVSYIAPELVTEGKSDQRADVYAMGVILYELLTGQKPHQGETPIQVAWRHVHDDIPHPSLLMPDLPRQVDDIVALACARDRRLRTPHAAAMLSQVNDALGISSPGSTTTQRTSDLSDVLAAMADTPIPPSSPQTTTGSLPTAAESTDTGLAPIATNTLRAKPASRRRGPLYLALLLIVTAAVAGGAWWYGSGRYTTTPSLIGMSESAAEGALNAAGLKLAVGEPVYSEDVPKGVVVSTEPRPGERVLPGEGVTVVLSLGKERYVVPKLAGLPPDQAEATLEERNLAIGGIREMFSESVAKGVVISSEPNVGSRVPPDTPVQLVVSKGPQPIQVGSWVGKKATDAIAELQKRGLDPVVANEFSDEVPKGVIISQSPESGTLFKGEQVTLTVSQGPELVQIPFDIVGLRVRAARLELQELGFEVQVRKSDRYLGLRYVVEVDPAMGEEVQRGSLVTLFII
jgi:eukaryotic-like serine/threonine-protein kinase